MSDADDIGWWPGKEADPMPVLPTDAPVHRFRPTRRRRVRTRPWPEGIGGAGTCLVIAAGATLSIGMSGRAAAADPAMAAAGAVNRAQQDAQLRLLAYGCVLFLAVVGLAAMAVWLAVRRRVPPTSPGVRAALVGSAGGLVLLAFLPFYWYAGR